MIDEQKTIETKEVKETDVGKQLGFSKEQQDEINKNNEEYPPSLEIPMGSDGRVIVKITNLDFKEITKNDKDKTKVKTLNVEDETGVKFTMWLSGESIRRELYRIIELRKKQGKDPIGMVLAIWKETYQHDIHGDTHGYKMQILSDDKIQE